MNSKQTQQQIHEVNLVCDELYSSPYQANEDNLHAELQKRGSDVDVQLVRSALAEKQNRLTWGSND